MKFISKDGIKKELNNKTPLSRVKGKLLYNCDFCNAPFYRYACQDKGGKNFCGVGCTYASHRIPINKKCIICRKMFTVYPTQWLHKMACSKECNRALHAVLGKNEANMKNMEVMRVKRWVNA